MSPRPLTRRESQARTRERLLTSAEREFLRRGFGAASIDKIAQRAGYTTGAVYSNFSNKEELALGVLERRMATVASALQEGLAAAEPTLEARLAAIEHLMNTMLGHEDWIVFSTEFALATRRRTEIRKQFGQRLAIAKQAMAALLRVQHDEVGIELPMDPERLGSALVGLGIGLSVLRIADPEVDSGLLTDTLGLLLAGLDVGEKRPRARRPVASASL